MRPDEVARKGADGGLGQALDFVAAGSLAEAEATCRALLVVEPDHAIRVPIPSPPEFRWMAPGSGSPWFPTCAVYGQDLDRSWDAALRTLPSDLAGRHGHGEQSPRDPP